MAIKSVRFVVLLLISMLPLSACDTADDAEHSRVGPRNVILFVGDGLGAAQTTLAVQYARIIEERALNIDTLMQSGNTGYALPLPFDEIVIDSAAAATQFATGQPVRNETLGLDAAGDPIETILEWAHARGIGTGIVSNMRVTHATPAAFAAHQGSRYDTEQALMDDLLREGDIDVLLGGGARAMVPAGTWVSASLPGVPNALDGESVRDDDVNRVEELLSQGYNVVSDTASLNEAKDSATRLVGMFASSHLPYVLDRQLMGLSSVPTLAEMASAAIDVLSRDNEGFFLVVEGGRIDYAGHANDPGSLLHELLAFDETVGVGLEFQRNNPDTLVLVTGDHGTGGFSFSDAWYKWEEPITLDSSIEFQGGGYPNRSHLEMLFRQGASYSYMLEQAGLDPQRLIELVLTHTGLELTIGEAREALARDDEGRARPKDFRPFYSDPDDTASALLGRALSRHTHVVWSTAEHTMEFVPTYGIGPGAEKLRGIYPNTTIYSVMREALDPQP